MVADFSAGCQTLRRGFWTRLSPVTGYVRVASLRLP
jgi:hypothetical protein